MDPNIKSINEAKKDERKRNHKCKLCEKSYHQSGSLKRHVSSFHEKRKDHNCNSCGKSFNQSSDLKTHFKFVHETVTKNNKCESCEKLFPTAPQPS